MTDKELARESWWNDNNCSGALPTEKIYECGFLAGVEAGRPKWHKVADGDLPKGNCENILLYNKDHFCVTHSYSLGYYENGVFYNDCEMEEDTIAWCEIPQYTEE